MRPQYTFRCLEYYNFFLIFFNFRERELKVKQDEIDDLKSKNEKIKEEKKVNFINFFKYSLINNSSTNVNQSRAVSGDVSFIIIKKF